MSNVGKEHRSFLPIEKADLLRLAEIARQDREHFFKGNRQWAKAYGSRYLGSALCQGAAVHYWDCLSGKKSKKGINDFDVYSFYETNPSKRWYSKRIKAYDFGDSKFGQSFHKSKGFIGRRVDCLGRDIKIESGENLPTALKQYLETSKTRTARELALKAVILLDPDCGLIIWPYKKRNRNVTRKYLGEKTRSEN